MECLYTPQQFLPQGYGGVDLFGMQGIKGMRVVVGDGTAGKQGKGRDVMRPDFEAKMSESA
jgi:hypothetical protein